MRTIASLFERALAGDDSASRGAISLSLDPAFQGLPEMAHGGTVLALFDAAAALAGARVVHGHYRKRVPLGVSLRLALASHDRVIECHLRDESDTLLVDGTVTPSDARVDTPDAGASSLFEPSDLPVSSTCFVCGVDNEIGLRARFQFDADTVRATWRPTESVRERDGTLAPVALTALLDEAAFWLGALATGESGMTTELAIELKRLPSFDSVITVVGDRTRVTTPSDARYRDTGVAALDETGNVIATGSITFVRIRGSAGKLATRMLAMNPPEMIRRVFPSYAP